ITLNRPIKWDKTYYSFTGFRDPEEELDQAQRVETTLTSWLDDNEASAVIKLKKSLPLREELERLKFELSHQLQLSDIRSFLRSLGRTVVFTDRSGMSATGHVMLGTMDVHHHWTKVRFQSKCYCLLQMIEVLQKFICSEYANSAVAYLHGKKILFFISITFHYSDRYTPSLHEFGHFTIPTVCDPATLRWFIIAKAQEARANLKRREEMMITEKELIDTSAEKFSLDRLYKEPSVTSAQMIDCCKRLLEESLPYLQGMHLCISHFYSVLQDGDLCIPWNWKS
uniref:DUF4461 domain-containing protein n=1 Tax=Pavo cristatus TaxID=9049 RepID=A0A8C9FRU9_PAVCR